MGRDYAMEFLTFANASDSPLRAESTRTAYDTPYRSWYEYGVERGRKFDKITHQYMSRVGTGADKAGGRSVHCFIDKATGDIYKAESWRKPAKHVRFNWDRDRDTLAKVADPHGGYLYMI